MEFAGTVHVGGSRSAPESVVVLRRYWQPRLLRACALTLLAAVSSGACSGGAAAPDPESITVVGVAAFREIDTGGSYVAPDGSAWIYRNDDELCVGLQSDPDADPTCAPWDRSFSEYRVSWSNDAKRVLFTEDAFVRLDESDVSEFDIEAGRIDVLTDDGVDEFGEPDADADELPFYGPEDLVYFFRYARDEGSTLYRIVDGIPEPVDGGRLGEGPRIFAVPQPWGENTWVYPYFEGDRQVRFAALTFDGSGATATVSVNKLPGSTDQPALPVDWRGGTVVLARQDFANNNAPIVVRPDERTSSDLPVDEQTMRDGFLGGGVTVSPDGKHVLELRDDGDGTVRCTVWRINSDGGSLSVEPVQVGTVADQRMKGGFVAVPGSVGWDGGTKLTAISSAGVVVFDVTTG